MSIKLCQKGLVNGICFSYTRTSDTPKRPVLTYDTFFFFFFFLLCNDQH